MYVTVGVLQPCCVSVCAAGCIAVGRVRAGGNVAEDCVTAGENVAER